MRFDDFLPPIDDRAVLSFCDSICRGVTPFYVPVQIRHQSSALRCFENVAAKVEREGGNIIFGWNITQMPKVYIEAQFHAVWQSPATSYIDVTPEPSPHPSIPQPRQILFLRDIDRRGSRPTVPSHRAALGDPILVARYWHLAEETMAIQEQMGLAGFSFEAFAQRTAAARSERQTILERLQNAV